MDSGSGGGTSVKRIIEQFEINPPLSLSPKSGPGTRPISKRTHRYLQVCLPTTPQMWLLQGVSIFLLSALLIFSWLYWQKDVPLTISLPLGCILGLGISIGSVLSLKFRCTLALCIPQLTTQQGRLILLTIISGLLIGGPVTSIMLNAQETTRSVSCIPKLAVQAGKGISEAYEQAYRDMTDKVKDTIRVWQDIADGVQAPLEPIRNELETVSTKLQKLKTDVGKVNENCENAVKGASSACKSGVGGVYNTCRNVAKIIPFNKGNGICNPLEPSNICRVVDSNVCGALNIGDLVIQTFGKLPVLLESFRSLFEISVELKDGAESRFNASTNATAIWKAVKDEIDMKYEIIKNILSGIQYALILTILLVPLKAFLYLQKELKHGNGSGPRGKCIEETETRSAYFCFGRKKSRKISKADRQEQKEMRLQLVLLLTHVLLSASVIVFDQTLYWINSIVREHGNSTFTASGEAIVNLEIEGGAILKPLMQAFLNSFNLKREYSFEVSTDGCLPDPVKPNGVSYILSISILYLLTIVLVVMGNSVARKRYLIVNYFYPDSPSHSNTS